MRGMCLTELKVRWPLGQFPTNDPTAQLGQTQVTKASEEEDNKYKREMVLKAVFFHSAVKKLNALKLCCKEWPVFSLVLMILMVMLTIIRMAVVGGNEVAWLIGAWKIANWPQHHIGHKRHQYHHPCHHHQSALVLETSTFWNVSIFFPLTPEVSRPAGKRKF